MSPPETDQRTFASSAAALLSTATPLELARSYIARGWNPVPLPHRSKAPLDDGWQTRRIDADTVHIFFDAERANIGIVLGPSSGGLTDVDLDCPEAIYIASYVLPPKSATFGRASARGSHRLYLTTLGLTGTKAVYAFDDPEPGTSKARLVELRCGGVKGAQTVFPGSVHESGEAIGWDDEGEPTQVGDEDLLNRVRLLAVASLLARAWPAEGTRHDAARIVGGFLARAGIPSSTIKLVVEGIVRAVGDPEPRDRVTAAADAATAYAHGERAYGYPALRDLIGDRRARRIADWIAYDAAAEVKPTDRVGQPTGQAGPAATIKPTPFVWQDPATFPRRQWLLGYDYCRKYLSGLISPGGAGKSSLLLIEALVLVTGRPLLGVKPRETVKVWYFNGEDPREETLRRLLAAMKHYRIGREEVEGRLFVDSGRDTPITIAEAGKDGTRIAVPTIEAITRQMIELQIGAMLVDPFVSTHGVGENDNVAINIVARQWGLIAERTNSAIGLAHHARKPGGETVTTETSRGASSLMDAVRIGRAINRMTKAQADELRVDEPSRCFRIGGADSPGKHNMAPPIDKTHWFQLVSVDMGNGAPSTGNPFDDFNRELQGEQSDHVAVVDTWEPPNLIDNVDNVAQLEEIQKRATAGKWRKSQQSIDEPWVGLLVAEVLSLDDTNKGHRALIRKLLAMWYATKALVVYEAKDSHGEVKPYVRGGPGDGGIPD